jgi:hypothetical protein
MVWRCGCAGADAEPGYCSPVRAPSVPATAAVRWAIEHWCYLRVTLVPVVARTWQQAGAHLCHAQQAQPCLQRSRRTTHLEHWGLAAQTHVEAAPPLRQACVEWVLQRQVAPGEVLPAAMLAHARRQLRHLQHARHQLRDKHPGAGGKR